MTLTNADKSWICLLSAKWQREMRHWWKMQIFVISGGLNFLGKRVFVNIITIFRSGVSIAIIQTAGLGTQTGVHIQVIIQLLFIVKNRKRFRKRGNVSHFDLLSQPGLHSCPRLFWNTKWGQLEKNNINLKNLGVCSPGRKGQRLRSISHFDECYKQSIRHIFIYCVLLVKQCISRSGCL